MGQTNVIVGTELRDWLISQQVWREGVYIVGDRTYGGDGRHYLDVVSDKLEPGFHGLREIVVRGRAPSVQDAWAASLTADLPLWGAKAYGSQRRSGSTGLDGSGWAEHHRSSAVRAT
jgi:hypothetical protein